MQRLRTRRLERASALLADTTMPITDVALACGFADHSHFSSCFRAAYGTSPSRFRAARRDTWH